MSLINNRDSKKRVKRVFADFVNILDTKSDYYILNSLILQIVNENITNIAADNTIEIPTNDNIKESEQSEQSEKSEQSSKCEKCEQASNINPPFVAKNADHILLPLPREDVGNIYNVCGGVVNTRGVTDARDNAKINNSEIYNIDIDGKNTCYIKNCTVCKHRISFKINKININIEINSIADLIKLCNDYKLAENVEYNIDMKSLHKIKDDLIDLNNMIGMKTLKENIVDQLLFYLQNLHISRQNNKTKNRAHVVTGDFLHTVIYGSPGTGKTEVAKIIGRIYSNLGVIKSKPPALSSDKKKFSLSSLSSLSPTSQLSPSPPPPSSRSKFKKVTRSDLIAGYLGQTALKTKDVIKDSLGGVLFIDEAYSLGNIEKRDSFAKECIDTLCEALSDNKDNLMVIIAGYEKDLNECFFSYNDGLDSRFIWRFKVDDYTAEDLRDIFVKKVGDMGWSVCEELRIEWFEKNMKYFKFFGRDMETLFTKTKIAHSRRVFCKSEEIKTKITMKDLENGFEIFIKNEEVKNRVNESGIKILQNMYL